MAKTEVRIIEIKGERFIHQDDVVRLILNIVPAMADPDDRATVKALAENIASGTVKD